MERVKKILTMLFLLGLSSAVAQTSNGTGGGKWSESATWTGGSVPTGSGTITIQASDSIYIDVPVTITGTIRSFSGKIGTFDSSKVVFGNGGVYEHDVNGGMLPKATWNTGSTCLIDSLVGNAPTNGNQNFYNLSWDCPNQSAGLNLGMSGNTIGGNVRIIRSNRQYMRLTAQNIVATNKTITINGDCLLDDSTSYFTSTGSSGADSFTVITKGSIISHGLFNVANGSGATMNWYVGGDVKALGGSFTTNSTTTKPDSLIFNGTTKQSLVRATSSMSNIQFDVRKGAIIDFDTNSLGGSANTSFTLEAGATIMTAHAKGIQGNLNNGGAKSLSLAANYIYDGTAAQIDSLMPTTVNNLTINNASGVTLVYPTTINGVLTLSSGVFDNTVPFTLGPNGSIVFAGGSLKITTLVPTKEMSIPKIFYVDQNYPNPFNPSTTISYGIPKNSFVTVRIYNVLGQEVTTLYSGQQNAGSYALTFDASALSSGVYLYRIQAGNSVETKRMVLMK
ncbi:MAG TPA: T9SS type A sorting domain-containing protein [Bacteroidota bacterium]|nr:T9SS type A sorting domain-containing protein [Bacteroidota bacterium]